MTPLVDLGLLAVEEEAVPVTYRSKAGGSYDADGDWVGETLVDAAITAVVQPAMGRKLLDLPEGERTEAKYFLWSRSALVVDDIVVYAADNYRINFVWPRPDGGFYRAAMGLLKT